MKQLRIKKDKIIEILYLIFIKFTSIKNYRKQKWSKATDIVQILLALSNLVQSYSLMEKQWIWCMKHEAFIYDTWMVVLHEFHAGGSTSLFYVHSFAEEALHCAWILASMVPSEASVVHWIMSSTAYYTFHKINTNFINHIYTPKIYIKIRNNIYS